MAMPCHITMEGEKQGRIEGCCDMDGREESILGYWMRHQIMMLYSPTDGLPTGKRGHGPLQIIKGHDKSSPKLHQALSTGEHMKYVDIKWYRINKYGNEEHYFTHSLEDAIITSISSFMPNTILPEYEQFPLMEKVAFSYRNIRWTYEPRGIEAEDKHVTAKKRTDVEDIDPYMNEYGKNPLKDIGVATLMAGAVVWEAKKTAVTDVAKAALLSFLEIPWYLDRLFTTGEIYHNTTHEYREKALDLRHKFKNIKDNAYGHKR
jgi:type VI secretion system secreted protein Hcp